MAIKTNQELSQAIEKAIEESGYKKMYIADQIGIKNQNLKRYIYKNNMSLDDANKLLYMIYYDQVKGIKKGQFSPTKVRN